MRNFPLGKTLRTDNSTPTGEALPLQSAFRTTGDVAGNASAGASPLGVEQVAS
jgi:hypothetical protein